MYNIAVMPGEHKHGKIFAVSWNTVRRAQQLADGGIAAIVVSFIANTRELNQCLLGGYVVLPDEVHVVFSPKGNNTADTVVRYIRRASERLINREIGRTGEVWDEKVIETQIKNEKLLAETMHKIEYLPCKRNMVKYPSDYPHSHLSSQHPLDQLDLLFKDGQHSD